MAALLMAASFFTVNASAAEALSIEQVKLAPPDMDVYVHADDADLSGVKPDDVKAQLGSHTFDVKSIESQGRLSEGIFYAFLLDVSGSIPQSSLDAAVKSIGSLADDMTSKDRLAVITFGDKVNVISDGSKAPEKTLRALKGLKADDQNTAFYTAMDSLIKVTKKAGDLRTVAVVFSDGVDDTDAGMTEQELTDTLKQSGVAVYAMQVGKVTADQTKHLKAFIKVSGGQVYRYDASNAAKTVKSLVGHLGEVYCISLAGDSELSVDKDSDLKLSVKGFEPLDWTVKAKTWEVAAGENPGEGKKTETVTSDASSDGEASVQETITDKNIEKKQAVIFIAIIAVIIVAAAVVVILLMIHRKKAREAFFKENGLDPHEIEEIDKKIRQKRRRH